MTYVFCVSSTWCHALVCNVSLWYFLVINIYFLNFLHLAFAVTVADNVQNMFTNVQISKYEICAKCTGFKFETCAKMYRVSKYEKCSILYRVQKMEHMQNDRV